MRLKIHESTIKTMSKMMNSQMLRAADDYGNLLIIIKRGHFVVIEIEEGVFR